MPRAERKHGTHSSYSKGCRCEPCRVAHRTYERNQSRVRRRDQQGVDPRPPTHVDATEARTHVQFLRSKGVGLVQLSKKTGLSKNYLQQLSRGEFRTIRITSSEKLLALPAIHELPGQYVPSAEAKKLIAELLEAGLTKTQISMALNAKTKSLAVNDFIRLKRLEKLKALHRQVVRKYP